MADTCAVTLPASAAAPAAAPAGAPFATPRSLIIVSAEVPLANVKQALDAKVGIRVAEEKDHDIGVAGRLEYTVDRGPFVVSIQGDALVVESPLVAHARACAKGNCYAGCDPEARVTARVPLRLGADYKFRPSSVKIDVTRGCELRAMGGIVRIDVTPMLAARLAQETPRIEQQIQHELPDLRPEAERIWGELGKARPLALGSCIVLLPEGLVQGPATGVGALARLRFGLYAKPELRLRCGDAPKPTPLPPLASDIGLPLSADVNLALILPPEAAAIALDGGGDPIDLGRARARVAHATGTPTALSLQLSGEACGTVGMRAGEVAWGDDGRTLHLGGVAPLAGEAERMGGAGLDPAALTGAVARAPIAVPLAPDQLKSTLPDLAAGLSDDRVAVSATVADASPNGAGVRGAEIVAVVRIRGAATLRAK